MQFLSAFPFILIAWTLTIFAYESYKGNLPIDTLIYCSVVFLILHFALRRYRDYDKRRSESARIIALNIALSPLLYNNLIITHSMLQNHVINETETVYIFVMVYSPILYIGVLVLIEIYKYLSK